MVIRSPSFLETFTPRTWRELVSHYRQIRIQTNFQPNTHTFPSLLKSSPNLPICQSIHADATKRGFQSDPFVSSAIVSSYCQHNSLHNALELLDEIPEPNTIIWNAAISTFFRSGNCDAARKLFTRVPSPNDITWSAVVAGFAQNGHAGDSLSVFKRMRREVSGSPLSSNLIASVLSACVQLRDLVVGEQVHGYIIKISAYATNDEFVGAALVDMYGRCGNGKLSRRAFEFLAVKNVVGWSSLISSYVHENKPLMAMVVFKEMIYSGEMPNNFTLSTVIAACSRIPSLVYGKELHGFIFRRRLGKPDTYVTTALIDMYSKCRYISYACRVFENDGELLDYWPTPMWNVMISAYAANDCIDDALRMIRLVGRLNSVTMATILPICASFTLLLYGKELHCYALKHGLDKELLVGNGLLNMYSKCGKITWARKVFDLMTEKNRISWTTLIDGYGMHGDPHGAIRMFERMVREKSVEPDHITFVVLISACSHSGLVEEGLKYFEAMSREYGIIPTEENYGCLVDLLARSGRFDEAKNVIQKMPMRPSANVWGALLGACRIHGKVDEAELAVENLLKLGNKQTGFQALLSSIYAEMGRLDGAAEVRKVMVEMNVPRRRGCSWLEAKEVCT